MRALNSIGLKIRNNDKKRVTLLRKGRIAEFLQTYTKNYDIENLNTGKYWDNIFSESENLSHQSPMTKDKIRLIANAIPSRNLSILDLGIGDGFVEELLEDRSVNYKLFGLDISYVSIEKMQKKYRGRFVLGNVLEAKRIFKNQNFDIILAIELLEHISVSKLFFLYGQIYSLLKNDGKFIFSIPINENLHLMDKNPSAHVRDYTYEIINAELIQNGFEIKKSYSLYAFRKMYKLKKLLTYFFRRRWKPNSLIIVAKKVVK